MADSRPAPPRAYRSPLRERQSRQTRDLILSAFAELVVAQGTSRVTMGAVAERAGVAERTVYRHFPSNRALLDGLSGQANAVMRERGIVELSELDLDEALDRAEDLYRAFHEAGAPLKAAVIAGLAEGYRNPGQAGRIEGIRRAVRAAVPGLPEDRLDEAVVMLRFQLGAWAWYLLTEREGLSTEQAARLSATAVRAFLDHLRREVTAAG